MGRFRMPRTFYIPKGATKVADKLSDAVAYLYTIQRTGKAAAVMFQGKADKPAYHYTYRSVESRNQAVAEFFASRQKSLAYKAERKAKRMGEGRGLEVGDILKASWGYEQTNIDYYEVTALVGSRMVELREIAQETIETAFMQGKCVPLPGNYVGEPIRKVAHSGSVKLAKWGKYARRQEPQIVGGVKIYEASHWTAYA